MTDHGGEEEESVIELESSGCLPLSSMGSGTIHILSAYSWPLVSNQEIFIGYIHE